MIGLGVGIDYALFIVTRYREGLKLGLERRGLRRRGDRHQRPRRAVRRHHRDHLAARPVRSSGSASSRASPSPRRIGVLMMILGSLTLLPALLGWVGTRIDNTTRAALIAVALAVVGAHRRRHHRPGRALPRRLRCSPIVFFAISFAIKSLRKLIPHRAEQPKEQRFWYRWSRFIQHRPWPSCSAPSASCSLLAIPLFVDPPRLRRLRQLPGGQDGPPGLRPARRGLRPGLQRSAVHHRRGRRGHRPGRARRSSSRPIADTDDVAAAVPGRRRSTTSLALVIVYPESAPQDAETTDARQHLRDDVIPATGRRRQGRRLHRRRRSTSPTTSPAACRC